MLITRRRVVDRFSIRFNDHHDYTASLDVRIIKLQSQAGSKYPIKYDNTLSSFLNTRCCVKIPLFFTNFDQSFYLLFSSTQKNTV